MTHTVIKTYDVNSRITADISMHGQPYRRRLALPECSLLFIFSIVVVSFHFNVLIY